jgi:hypothetical protein
VIPGGKANERDGETAFEGGKFEVGGWKLSPNLVKKLRVDDPFID